jgi:tetratricopeptide (TPR) repeat protein
MPHPKDPHDPPPATGQAAVVVPIADARERRRRNKQQENLRQLEDAVEGFADEPDGHTHFTLVGNLCFIEGEHEDAIRSYTRALSLAPNDLPARAGRARARMRIFELDLALADFDRALELAPDDAKLHFGRGYCLSQLIHGRWERGVDDAETADEQRIRCEEALESLERAAELGLDTPSLYYELVCVREEMGEPIAHLAMLDRAIAALPDEIPLLAVRQSRRQLGGDTAGAEADRLRLLELGVDVNRK